MMKVYKIWEKVSSSLQDLYVTIMPHSKSETIIVISTLVWFLLFSMFFAFSVDFSYKNEIMGYDGIFYIGLDNPKLRLDKIFSWNLRHPIFVLINYPILIFDAILPAKCHVAIFALASSLITAFSNLLIFKICRQLSLNTINCIIPVILFPTFAHVLLLSGQAETYVYTIFFMLLSILLAHTRKSTIITDNIIFAFLTGSTLTNCVFFFIIKFWEEGGAFKKAVSRTLKSSLLFLPLFAMTFVGLVFRYFVKHLPLYEAILNDTHKFVHDSNNLLQAAWDHYLSEPFLFHQVHDVVLTENAEVLTAYPSLIYHVIVVVILGFSVWGLINSKVLLRSICLSVVLYNIIIHFVCGYGNNELQLFCGHWIFFVPVLIAIGLNAIKFNFLRNGFIILLFVCALFMAIHNGYCYFDSILMCLQYNS